MCLLARGARPADVLRPAVAPPVVAVPASAGNLLDDVIGGSRVLCPPADEPRGPPGPRVSRGRPRRPPGPCTQGLCSLVVPGGLVPPDVVVVAADGGAAVSSPGSAPVGWRRSRTATRPASES